MSLSVVIASMSIQWNKSINIVGVIENNADNRVGLDSEKRIFNEKMRKDAKRAEKEGKYGKRDY